MDVILASHAHHVPQVGFPHIDPVTKAIILKTNPDGAKLLVINEKFLFLKIIIPKNVRPRKDQPFYHLLAENDEITYEAYVSEQNLLVDDSDEPIKHPLINEIFSGKRGSSYFKPSN